VGTKTTNKSDGASLVSKLGIFSVFLFAEKILYVRKFSENHTGSAKPDVSGAVFPSAMLFHTS